MARPITVAASPLTGNIYAGRPNAKGDAWTGDKTDVTGAVCAAVAMHALHQSEDGTIVVNCNDIPRWEITVVDLTYGK